MKFAIICGYSGKIKNVIIPTYHGNLFIASFMLTIKPEEDRAIKTYFKHARSLAADDSDENKTLFDPLIGRGTRIPRSYPDSTLK
jgi:hypothetical protein